MPFVKKNDSQGSQPPTDVHKIFIGRTVELLFFMQNILKPVDPTHNIISISGQGGVGKSTLLARFIDEAHSPNFKDYCLTAMVDERQTTPASIMEKFADQLRITGKFEKALKQYKETLRKLQTERETPFDTISRSLPEFAGAAAESVPIAGPLLREGVKAGTKHLLGRYHTNQIRRDAEILEDPLDDLTKAFVEELNHLAETQVMLSIHHVKRLRIILFFDTFEQLAVDAAPWLLDYFLEANINNHVVLVVAGRDPIEQSSPDDPKRWLPYHDSNSIYSISLDVFTEEETRLYLADRDVTDPDSVVTIWQLSQGLPLYLSLLTSNPHGKVDPTANVVANFLRWIPEQERIKRQLALDAALFSRSFNQDDLEAFTYLSEHEQLALYRWLIGQPFVRPQDGRYSYHDLARELFSRYLFQRSKKSYYASRRALVKHYQHLLEEIQVEEGKQVYGSVQWLELALALAQQLFLLPDEASHIKAIEQILDVYKHIDKVRRGEIIRVLRELSQEQPNNQTSFEARQVGKNLLQYIEACMADQSWELQATASNLLEKVAHIPIFSPTLLATICYRRGRAYRKLKEYGKSLADHDRAIELDPQNAWAYVQRGITYIDLKDHQRGINDLDHAIALKPNDAKYYHSRGLIYRSIEDYEQAIADFNHAIALNPKEAVFYRSRGRAYYIVKDYQQAIASYNRALELNSNDVQAHTQRGQTYMRLKDYQRAIADVDRALELDRNDAWAYIQRSRIYMKLKDYRQAMRDIDHALDLDPNYAWAYSHRGFVFLWLKDAEQAKSNYARSWELDSTDINSGWMAEWSAMCQKKPDPAMAERLEQIASVDPQNDIALVCRGIALLLRGNPELSLTELEQAIAVDETWDGYFWKGIACASLGRDKEAIVAIEQSLKEDLPPILLAPLRWFEQDRPEFYEHYAAPLLARYDL